MEKSELHEILNALKLHSEHIDKQMDALKTSLENQMDNRFDRLEKKVDGIRIDLSETQETVNFLSSKYVQHEKKLQSLINHQS